MEVSEFVEYVVGWQECLVHNFDESAVMRNRGRVVDARSIIVHKSKDRG